jgi:hypothetical protein
MWLLPPESGGQARCSHLYDRLGDNFFVGVRRRRVVLLAVELAERVGVLGDQRRQLAVAVHLSIDDDRRPTAEPAGHRDAARAAPSGRPTLRSGAISPSEVVTATGS